MIGGRAQRPNEEGGRKTILKNRKRVKFLFDLKYHNIFDKEEDPEAVVRIDSELNGLLGEKADDEFEKFVLHRFKTDLKKRKSKTKGFVFFRKSVGPRGG